MQKYFISFISNDKRWNELLILKFDFKNKISAISVKLLKIGLLNNILLI
jgi:hypothetical protein